MLLDARVFRPRSSRFSKLASRKHLIFLHFRVCPLLSISGYSTIMEASLQRYRRDRRKILHFILSSDLVNELRPKSPSDAELDLLSADYVLHCVHSGGVVDIAEATNKYYEESTYPVTILSQVQNSYFLISDPDLAGSPPRREPPPIFMNHTVNHASHSSVHLDSLIGENIPINGDERGVKNPAPKVSSLKLVENVGFPSLGLPILNTGLSDDDLRQTAYESLLGAMVFSGMEVHFVEERRKEKGSKFLSGLKSKRDKIRLRSQSSSRNSEIIDTIRVQMQISEAMDSCIRQRLMQLASSKTCGRVDVPQIAVGLLGVMVKSDFLNEKSYMQWKKRQVNIVEEFLCFSDNHITRGDGKIKDFLGMVRNAKEWDVMMSLSDRSDVLLSIKAAALELSSIPGQFGIPGETYYWTAGYHLNIRIYEKLLFAVFDILEEGSLISEADEILMLLKLTWSTLGITKKIHDVLYGWVLFQQFLRTEEATLLDYAILEVQKVLSVENNDLKERQYMNSLACSSIYNNNEIKSCLVEAVFFSMSLWCDGNLQDYHLHFSQKPCNFKKVMILASAVGVPASRECGELKLIKLIAPNEFGVTKLQTYVKSSIEAAYKQVADYIDFDPKIGRTHPLALLANKLRQITGRELTVFFPVLRHWCPEAGMISAKTLHQLYGEKLKPFLSGVTCLSKDTRLVLPAADMLDHDLTQLYSSACEERQLNHPLSHDLDHYPVGELSRPIILDWVIAQQVHVLEWTGRAFDLEDWEPLSFHQKQAASIVEVFRIIEETVDQFFGLNLPMDITHFQALLSVIYHTLDTYLLKLANQLVEKKHLLPSAPSLTRYTETFIPTIKKKFVECTTLLDEKAINKLNELTIPKLCIRLNSVQYLQKKIGTLEDGIRNSWAHVRLSANQATEEHPEILERPSLSCSESVDELFLATFNSIKDTTTSIISKLCDFIGARVVFWDLRGSFLFRLYRGNVEGARLDCILSHVDTVLDHICGLIVDDLRDLVVLSICRASLEGYILVLLDGGPSRAFSESDVVMMEDDFNMLKEFFIADGEGLPHSLVEQEAKAAQQILSLFSLQTDTLIQMLMTASEHISTGLDSHNHDWPFLEDAHTLIRILCHKKDREASKFLKIKYQLPMSSEYDDTPSNESALRSPLIPDLLKRSTSFHWTEKGQSSFRSMKKKLQEATSELRHAAW